MDDSIAPDMEYLRTVAVGDFQVISRTLDDSRWIVVYPVDDGPARYYSYDRARKEATFLFTHAKELEGYRWPNCTRRYQVARRAGPGRLLHAAGGERQGWLGASGPSLTDVLHVHGGPHERVEWSYCPLCQLLANRDYAVLTVNFRGSTGFGKAFVNAANPGVERQDARRPDRRRAMGHRAGDR